MLFLSIQHNGPTLSRGGKGLPGLLHDYAAAGITMCGLVRRLTGRAACVAGSIVPEDAEVRLTVSSGMDQHGHKCPELK